MRDLDRSMDEGRKHGSAFKFGAWVVLAGLFAGGAGFALSLLRQPRSWKACTLTAYAEPGPLRATPDEAFDAYVGNNPQGFTWRSRTAPRADFVKVSDEEWWWPYDSNHGVKITLEHWPNPMSSTDQWTVHAANDCTYGTGHA